jgi:DNA-binding NtrC family response regulator
MSQSKPKASVLVVDDEPLKRVTLQIELTEAGYRVYEAAEAGSALRLLESRPVDVVVTDLRMPQIDGLTFLQEVKQRRPGTYVILMTAYASVDTAVEAMKRGAYDYITKPFHTTELLAKLEKICAYQAGMRFPGEAADRQGPELFGRIVAHSHAMRNLFDQIRTVADSERTILIAGESGTGKELVAEAIHQHSRRREKPLVKFSCAALQPNILESELFGHERGAFTGAIRRKPGRFELAHTGTMFLDEVDDIPPELQVKLLRAIEQQEFERVGGEDMVRVDVRLICATKKNLKEVVEAGRFREDLYYRLNVITLQIPPLRERKDDIPALAEHFLRKHGCPPQRAGVLPTVSPHALDVLMAYDWPGNCRELEHVIERALAFCDGPEITPEQIPRLHESGRESEHAIPIPEGARRLTETVADVERRLIESALRQAEGNQAKAAQMLGIPRTTLRDKIAKYGLQCSVSE